MKRQHLLLLVLAAASIALWLTGRRTASELAAEGGNEKALPSVTSASPPSQPGKATPPAPAVKSSAPGAADLAGQVIVSFGKVEDMGVKTGTFLVQRAEQASLTAITAAERTPEQSRRLLELDRAHAEMLGMLPEIEQFQNSPDEYSRFYGSLISTAAGLDNTQSQQVTDYMRQRGEAMIAAGLNAAKEPADAAAEERWEGQRDDFNEATAEGVMALLPPGVAAKIGFDDKFLELMERDFDKAAPDPQKP